MTVVLTRHGHVEGITPLASAGNTRCLLPTRVSKRQS